MVVSCWSHEGQTNSTTSCLSILPWRSIHGGRTRLHKIEAILWNINSTVPNLCKVGQYFADLVLQPNTVSIFLILILCTYILSSIVATYLPGVIICTYRYLPPLLIFPTGDKRRIRAEHTTTSCPPTYLYIRLLCTTTIPFASSDSLPVLFEECSRGGTAFTSTSLVSVSNIIIVS
jgi:hypothetical protein